jgi:hypothetical protein
MLEQMNDPLRYHSGLAAARTRNDQQRPVAMLNRPKLFRIEQHAGIQDAGVRIQDSGKIRIPLESYPFFMNQATTFRLWRVLAGGANPCAAMYFGPNPELGIGSVLFQLVAPAFMPAIADPSLRSESVIFLDFWPFSST